ncbi:FUSC family protein [Xanthobacter tagetidis]|uniref:FUSC family protein n=1 Tax=Xanthobacter tagetidis TaxID=60216 RepID=A0A3L7A263_9HYPH|nr:FUSC family protein [Xanthobacter tagetidis]MBB6307754.1 multidrug resistance protein MdtO [Xanthobacter tagetidis]RLP74393.1 FUSC family protein [Xanthobacter tagetidis]
MAPAADAAPEARPASPWPGIARQAWRDVLPFPGRLAMAWRVALLCALVAGVAMLYKVPEAAIGCYLVIFLARPNGAECVGQALGVILLASVVVLAMAPVIQATAESPLLRILVIAGTSFVFVYLGAASQLGEIGSIIALVIAFILTLVDQVPAGEVVTRGLLYAWQMAAMPMALMVVFYLVLGTGPHTLLRRTVATRLSRAAGVLEGEREAREALAEEVAQGTAESAKQAMMARLFHTAPDAAVTWLSGAAQTSYRLLLAAAAVPADAARDAREALAGRCRAAAAAIAAGSRPAPAQEDAAAKTGPLAAIAAQLAALARADGGTPTAPETPPFLAPDALTNPDYQQYALKTTAAAITCYLVYSLIGWQGIHTAMITCYVAALGTTGETVHKLALRIGGCLIGACLGFLSILYVIPALDTVGGLMVLVFFGVLPAAWVSAGSERISYAGVQIGLAFLLTILNGFAPSLDMGSGRDRIVGILLGNFVVYLYFTGIWPKSAAADGRRHLARALAALARLAALAPPAREAATDEAALAACELDRAREQLRLLPFEPASQRPPAARRAQLDALAAETQAFLPALMFSSVPEDAAAHRLAAVAARLGPAGADKDGTAVSDAPPAGPIDARARRIAQLAAG